MKKLRSRLPETSANKLKPLLFNPSKSSSQPHILPSTTTSATKSFNSRISRLSSQDEHHQVIRTYASMLKSNVAPDPFTYPSLLKACTSLNLLRHGLLFHHHVIVSGISSDPYIATSLIPFYSKFGQVKNARKVFDMMHDRNIVPWTAMVGCYSRTGDMSSMFSMFNKMQYEGIKPASATIIAMLSGVTEVTTVKCLHSFMVKYGFDGNLVLLNCMLNAYGKWGAITDAKTLFDLMDRKDLITWNSLVSMYASAGNIRETLVLFNRMKTGGLEPDQQTFTSLVPVVSKEGTVRQGKTLHGLITTSGFQSSAHVETSIMSMYLKHGFVNNALRIFEKAEDKDVVFWTAMISGLVQNEYGCKAVELFRQMLLSGVMPSSTTIATALAACAQVASPKWGTSLHGYILRQGVQLDIPSKNSLISMYAKCGSVEQSNTVFHMMKERDVVSWNAIVAAHAQDGNLTEALCLFNEMRTVGFKQPDSITVVSLLQACASIGAYQQGKWIHTFVIRSYLGPCIMVDTALVDMYCKCGNLDTAKKCYDSMSQHDTVSWSTIITGYGSHGLGDVALEMYYKGLQDGFKPNGTIFLSILYACSHNGLVDQGMSLFDSMVNDYMIEPELEHRGCIVDLLCRAGRVEDAYSFYNRMFPEPAVDVLGILLDACRAKGKVELADHIGKEISMLNPADPGKYVQLANSYASMANWDGVGEALGQMKSLGLKKTPGWSFIEVHGTIVTFFRGQIYQPRYEDMTVVLTILGSEIRELLSSSSYEDFSRDTENT